MKQTVVWIGALIVGALLGLLRAEWLGLAANFVATVYTRLFQLLAVPTIALAVTNTLASLGRQQAARRIFGQTLGYTLLTTVVAAAVGLLFYVVIQPGNIPADVLAGQEASPMGGGLEGATYRDHILSVVPNNMVQPFLSGNVLSILIIAFAVGLGLARLEESQPKTAVINLPSWGYSSCFSCSYAGLYGRCRPALLLLPPSCRRSCLREWRSTP